MFVLLLLCFAMLSFADGLVVVVVDLVVVAIVVVVGLDVIH